jgi:hypothetical protein
LITAVAFPADERSKDVAKSVPDRIAAIKKEHKEREVFDSAAVGNWEGEVAVAAGRGQDRCGSSSSEPY